VADAKFELLIMATAVKEYFLRNGRFPDSVNKRRIPLSNPSIIDPFSSEALKMKTGSEECICYSFGPDQKDDDARITYDPTRTELLAGEILS
jgi:hypothetical protein